MYAGLTWKARWRKQKAHYSVKLAVIFSASPPTPISTFRSTVGKYCPRSQASWSPCTEDAGTEGESAPGRSGRARPGHPAVELKLRSAPTTPVLVDLVTSPSYDTDHPAPLLAPRAPYLPGSLLTERSVSSARSREARLSRNSQSRGPETTCGMRALCQNQIAGDY